MTIKEAQKRDDQPTQVGWGSPKVGDPFGRFVLVCVCVTKEDCLHGAPLLFFFWGGVVSKPLTPLFFWEWGGGTKPEMESKTGSGALPLKPGNSRRSKPG